MSLEDEGFTVFEASDADAAIEILNVHREIRLMFTDIDMPGQWMVLSSPLQCATGGRPSRSSLHQVIMT
ncbi:hypothetical protein [Rhizobium laguerreae]|uniref:hypothetical protein n=1 Tax=Rhizobium laguerreae TaxID=1076926 RepID=UPI0028C42237|nr:hypothetical protein [Rhizobium laguerreae]